MLVFEGNTFHHTGQQLTKDPYSGFMYMYIYIYKYTYKWVVPGSIILYTTLTARCFFDSSTQYQGLRSHVLMGQKTITTSWLNQPIGKICDSQIGSFPQVGVKIKNS